MSTTPERPESPRRAFTWGGLVAVTISVLAVLGVWSYADPNLKLPVISPLVCILKGGVFYDEPGDGSWNRCPTSRVLQARSGFNGDPDYSQWADS
jgi:hypothetical protein